MSSETITRARPLKDGTLVEVFADGSTRPLPDRTGWDALRVITDEEALAAALNDPDAQPATDERRTLPSWCGMRWRNGHDYH